MDVIGFAGLAALLLVIFRFRSGAIYKEDEEGSVTTAHDIRDEKEDDSDSNVEDTQDESVESEEETPEE
jgi:hypothetical protein